MLDMGSLPSHGASSIDIPIRDDDDYDNPRSRTIYNDGRSTASKSVASSISQAKLYDLEKRNKRSLSLMDKPPQGWMGGLNNAYINNCVNGLNGDDDGEEEEDGRRKKKRKSIVDELNKPTKKAVSFDNIELQLRNKIPESSSAEFTDPGCWGCRNGILTQSSLISDIPGFIIVADFIRTHLYKVSLDEFFLTIKNIFDEHLKYQVAEINGQEIPEDWSLDSIKRHFRHICDPAIDQRIKIHDLQTIYDMTRDNVFQKSTDDDEDDAKVEINRENLNTMIHIGSTLGSYYSRNNEKSAAFSDGITPMKEAREKTVRRVKQL